MPTEADGAADLAAADVQGEAQHVRGVLLRAADGEVPAVTGEVPEAAFFADRTTRRAAATLGVPRGTVKSRVHYAPRSPGTALAERGVR
ncbi:sigma factor-like helix-turn-helix DNA-binding protein [Streptomyces sp. NPDC020731]|uniref:sigma factor-like helix-turn-helix DNA-binding protein n=1 Tax=Streptomyces sp. NPDC020731 TaxID=3365085 RepID=UPI0037BC9935